MRVVVVGGGIAGLATAIALGRTGAEVDVLERADAFTEIGAGMQLAANGFRALDVLGVAQEVIDRAVPVRHLAVRDGATGEPLVTLTTGEDYRAAFGYPYLVVHRRDLHGALYDAARRLPGVRLHASRQVAGFDDGADGVTVRTTDGQAVTGEVLVGADGIRSTIRAQAIGDGPPPPVGHTIYRSVIDLADAPSRIRAEYADLQAGIPVTLWAGTDWHLVNYPIAGGRQLNIAISHADGDTSLAAGALVDPARVHAVPGDADTRVTALLASGGEWRRWTLVERPPIPVWSHGRAVLVGDAAHPMLQYAAQGAGMALEDAVMLARSLAGPGSVPDQLEAFTVSRSPRTAAVRELAVELGRQVYHTEALPLAERNRWLTGHSDSEVRELARWLHGSTTFTETPAGVRVPAEALR